MTPTASETLSVVIERDMPYPPEKIWRALTQPELIGEWLMKNDFKPVVGHRFTLRAEPNPHWDGVVDCEVLVVEPNRTLSYTWGASPGKAGTRLRMEQSGFRADQQQNYQGAKYGWQKFLASLERVTGGPP